MNKKAIRMVSALLAISMVLPIAACGKKKTNGKEKRSGQKITADTPWFDSEFIEIGATIDKTRELENFHQLLIGIDDKRIVVRTNGNYALKDTDDPNKWYLPENNIDQVNVIDRSTKKTIQNIDINFMKSNLDIDDGVTYSDGKIIYRYYTHIENTNMDDVDNYTYTEIVIDADTGTILDTHEYAPNEAHYDCTYKLNDYTIDTKSFYDESIDKSSYDLYVTSPDGDKNVVRFANAETGINYITFIALKDAATAVIYVSTDTDWVFYEMNLKSLEIKPANAKEYEWIDTSLCVYPFVNSEGSVFYRTDIGIYKLDFAAKKTEFFFNYSNCGVNRIRLSNLYLSDIKGTTITLTGHYEAEHKYGQLKDVEEFEIVELTKADKNPHAGKSVLELYSANDRSEGLVGDAIIKFNETNPNYYIEVTDRYEPVDFLDYSMGSSSDEYFMNQLNNSSRLSSQLAVDIMNGDGPDILMNAAVFSQLYSDNYLADLTPYVGDLDPSKYFTNIFDASRVNGKLYNVPVCYTINGIQTKSKDAGASGIGFTTTEYEKFLNETLNGNDVIYYGQPYYFALLFNACRDKFIVNGKADFSGPEFAALAEFVKNNVYEQSRDFPQFADDEGTEEFFELVAKHHYCFGAGYYLTTMVEYGNADAILGIPSADGRGPTIGPYITVAVSSHAQNKDACGEFVKILMSDDIQSNLAMGDRFVTNRDAFRKGAEAAVEYYNGDGFRAYFGGGGPHSQDRVVFSEKDINNIEKIIMSCSGIDTIDPQVSIILVEEMPAYFSGQKDLATVTRIAQDRAQKALDEWK